MEFLSAPLSTPITGTCSACSKEGVALTKALTHIEDHPTRKDAMKNSIKRGVSAHLVCEHCSKTHPLWSNMDDEPEPAQAR